MRAPKSVLALRWIVSLLMLGSVRGLWTMATDRPGILAQFPGAVSPLYECLFVLGVLGLLAAVGMLLLRRWAFILYAAVVVAMLVLDELADGPRTHQAAVAGGALLVFLCAWSARATLQSRQKA